MARKKVNLAWIQNDANRRSTLKKRRKGLLKKLSELATLCGVKACAVIYEPNEAEAEVWPAEAEAKGILQRFKAMPEMDQCQKMVDQEGFLRQRVSKLEEQIKRQRRENREMEMNVVMHQGMSGRSLRDVGVEEAAVLRRLFEEKARAVREKIEEKEKMNMEEANRRQGWMVEYRNPNPNPNTELNLRDEQGVFDVYGGGGGGLEDMMRPCINFEGQSSSLYPLLDF